MAATPRVATFSFDDGGWQDAEVMHVLKLNGIDRATFYIPSALLLESVYNVMSRDSIAPLYAGWEVGSHTITHRRLSRLTRAEAVHEIAESRVVLSAFFDRDVTQFSYPYGDVADHVDTVKRAGYTHARACLRDAPAGPATSAARDRHRQRITGILEERGRCSDAVDAAVKEDMPVHVLGHPWHMVLLHDDGMLLLAELANRLHRAGYTFLCNSEFYAELSK